MMVLLMFAMLMTSLAFAVLGTALLFFEPEAGGLCWFFAAALFGLFIDMGRQQARSSEPLWRVRSGKIGRLRFGMVHSPKGWPVALIVSFNSHTLIEWRRESNE